MQEQFSVDLNPTLRRRLGYISRPFRDFISGSDTGYTLLKGGVLLAVAAGLSTLAVGTLPFALPVIIVGVISGVVYFFSSLKDEHDRNKAEDQKIKELRALSIEVSKIAQQVECNNLLENLTNEDLTGLNDAQLLKILLHGYLKRLELLADAPSSPEFQDTLNKKRKKNGYLPGQEGIVRLIESVTGFRRRDPLFAAKVSAFLRDDRLNKNVPGLHLDRDFTLRLSKALNLGEFDPNQLIDLNPVPKKKGLLNRVGRLAKNFMFLVARGNTALAMVIGSSILLGFIATTSVVVWPPLAIALPIILIGGVLASASGFSSLLYARYVERPYIQNAKNLSHAIKQQHNQRELLYKLNRLNGKHYKNLNEYTEHPIPFYGLHNKFDILKKEVPLPPPRVPLSTKIRTRFDTFVQSLYGFSVGSVIGASVVGIGSILLSVALPPLGITILGFTLVLSIGGAIGGFIFGARYSRIMGKAASNAGAAEIAKTERVADLRENCEKRLVNGQSEVERQLEKSKHELVVDLINTYIVFINKTSQHPSYNLVQKCMQDAQGFDQREQLGAKELLDKKEKILQQLELATGIKRQRDAQTQLPLNNDNEFYNNLSIYLQRSKKTKENANQLVSEFKSTILGREITVNAQPPGWRPTLKGTWSKLTAINQLGLEQVVPLLGAVCVAIPLGFILFGPAALPPLAIIAGAVASLVVIHKVCEYQAKKNLKALDEIESKLGLIETIAKVNNKTPKLATTPKAKTSIAVDINDDILEGVSPDRFRGQKEREEQLRVDLIRSISPQLKAYRDERSRDNFSSVLGGSPIQRGDSRTFSSLPEWYTGGTSPSLAFQFKQQPDKARDDTESQHKAVAAQ